jgi:hypothetical protein
VTQEQVHLIGGFVFENALVADQKAAVVGIEGTQESDGTFSPLVDLQVSNDSNDNWKTIAAAKAETISAKINVYPGTMIFGLRVNLDVLQPFIGKYKFGRAVLKGGKDAIFRLSDLAPMQ